MVCVVEICWHVFASWFVTWLTQVGDGLFWSELIIFILYHYMTTHGFLALQTYFIFCIYANNFGNCTIIV